MNVEESKVNAEWTFKMLSESSVSIYGVVRHLSVGSVSPHKVLCKHGCALIDRLFPVCRFDSSCTLNGLLTKGPEQCWRFITIKGTMNCHGQEVAISLLSILAALNSTSRSSFRTSADTPLAIKRSLLLVDRICSGLVLSGCLLN